MNKENQFFQFFVQKQKEHYQKLQENQKMK